MSFIDTTERYLRTTQAARELSVTDQTIRNMIARGELAPVKRIGNLWLIPRATLDSYLEQATVKVAA